MTFPSVAELVTVKLVGFHLELLSMKEMWGQDRVCVIILGWAQSAAQSCDVALIIVTEGMSLQCLCVYVYL